MSETLTQTINIVCCLFCQVIESNKKQGNINVIIHYTFTTNSYSMGDNRMFHQSAHFINSAKTVGNQCADN